MKSILRKKPILIGLAGIILLAVIGGVLLLRSNPASAIGNLQVFKGSAEVVRAGKTEKGATGTEVRLKDHIKATSGSTVALVLKDNTIVRIEGGSEIEVTQLTYENGKVKDAQFNLINGRMWSRVKPLQKDAKFDVETPTITAAVRGTSFNTTNKDKVTGIYVYQRSVEVTLNQGEGKQLVLQALLLQMQQDSFKADFDKGAYTPPQEFFDEWIKFNQAEDDKLCRQLHDIPGCDSVGQTAVQSVVTPSLLPTPAPPPPTGPTQVISRPIVLNRTSTNPSPANTPPPTTQQSTTQNQPPPPPPDNPPPPPPPEEPPPVVETVSVECEQVIETTYYQCFAYHAVGTDPPTDITNDEGTVWSLLAGNGELSAGEEGEMFYYPQFPGDTVQATYNNMTGSEVIVVPDVVEDVTVTCESSSVETSDPIQCTATATYTSGNEVDVTSNPNTVWSLANRPDWEFHGGSVTSEGVYTPGYPGAMVQATFDNQTGSFEVDATALG